MNGLFYTAYTGKGDTFRRNQAKRGDKMNKQIMGIIQTAVRECHFAGHTHCFEAIDPDTGDYYLIASQEVTERFEKSVEEGRFKRLEVIDTDTYSLVFNTYTHKVEGWVVRYGVAARLVTRMGAHS